MNIRKKSQQQIEKETEIINRFSNLFFLSQSTTENLAIIFETGKENNKELYRNFLLWFRTYMKSYFIFQQNQQTKIESNITNTSTTNIFVARKKTKFASEYINRAYVQSNHFSIHSEPVEYGLIDSMLIGIRDGDGLTPEDPYPIYCTGEQTKIYTINTKGHISEIRSKPRLLNSINQYINHNTLEYMYEGFTSIRCHNFAFSIGLGNYSNIMQYEHQKLRIGDTIAFIAPSDGDFHFLVYLGDNIAIGKLAQFGIHFSSLGQSFTKNKMPNTWIIKPDIGYTKLATKYDIEGLKNLFVTNYNLWIEFLNKLKIISKTNLPNINKIIDC